MHTTDVRLNTFSEWFGATMAATIIFGALLWVSEMVGTPSVKLFLPTSIAATALAFSIIIGLIPIISKKLNIPIDKANDVFVNAFSNAITYSIIIPGGITFC